MKTPSGIVWLASFPKSGSSWFRIFLANLAAGENGPADINNLDECNGIANSRYEFEAATMLDSGLLSHDEIDNLRPRVYATIAADVTRPRWIKVHDAYTLTPDGEPMFGSCAACAAVYLVRDPRDVAVSLAYHYNMGIDDAIYLLSSPDSALDNCRTGMAIPLRQKLRGWNGHVRSWLDQTDMPVHTLRYEDLLADPVACFSAALRFAGKPAAKAEIERVMRDAEFTKLQRQENERAFAERMSHTAPFFRSGGPGHWREQLTAEQIARIEGVHAPLMQRLGYELSVVPRPATAADQRIAL
jgi:aryl sulfotransferase